jgi:hypothetical protein
MYCWGWDGFGQLGDGTSGTAEVKKRPALVTGSPLLITMDLGAGHTCIILDPSGAVNCWGWNSNGQLGDGTTTDRASWQSSQDFDRDGCTDADEMQTGSGSETTGGKRNPKNFWDFFDTPDTTNTTLSTAISASQVISPSSPLVVTVGSATNFPAAPNTLYIEQEKFSYSAKTSTTFTLDGRALNGTTAGKHNSGAYIVSNVRDRVVNSADTARIQARYGTSGNPNADPLAPPPAAGYHAAFDRRDDPNSSEPWDVIIGDGVINLADIILSNRQQSPVPHDCN